MTEYFSCRQEYESGKRRHCAGCVVARGTLFNISMVRKILVDRTSCLLDAKISTGTSNMPGRKTKMILV